MDYKQVIKDSLLVGSILSGVSLCVTAWRGVPALKTLHRDSEVIDLIADQIQMIHNAFGVEAKYRLLSLQDRIEYVTPYVNIAYLNAVRQRTIRFNSYIELAVKSKLVDILSQ